VLIVGDKGIINCQSDHDSIEESAAFEGPVRLITDSGRQTLPVTRSTHVAMIGQFADVVADVVVDGMAVPPELATGYDGVQAQWATEQANRQAAAERAPPAPAPRPQAKPPVSPNTPPPPH
jgi:hypothetical protein